MDCVEIIRIYSLLNIQSNSEANLHMNDSSRT